MKKYIFIILLFASMNTLTAQRVVTIPGGIVPGDSLVYDQIFTFLNDDAPNRIGNPKTIYELERGKVYLTRSAVDANYDLHIRAGSANPDKPMPLVIHTTTVSGNNNLDMIIARKNLILENIEFDLLHADNSFGRNAVKMISTNARAIISGCRIVNSRWSAIQIDGGDQLKLYISDCIIGNSGNLSNVGGIGRLLDIRPSTISVDTIVIQNTTSYNITDRLIRNMKQVINYVKLDHLTLVNMQGVHGCVQLGKTKEAYITNNIFSNVLTFGDRIGAKYVNEQLHPDKRLAIITHDSLMAEKIELRNNNIFYDQKIEDFFNVVTDPDTLQYPRAVNTYIKNFHLPADVSKAYFKEQLTFKNISSADKLHEFNVLYFANQNLGIYPNNFSSIYPYEWDVAYNTSSKSYTAGDDGYPLGDLNAWPLLKARWEQKLPAKVNSSKVKGLEAVENFPNPFKNNLEFTYTVTEEQQIEISVYNVTGQLIKSVLRNNHPAGTYNYSWDGMDEKGAYVDRGIYFVRFVTDGGIAAYKVIKN